VRLIQSDRLRDLVKNTGFHSNASNPVYNYVYVEKVTQHTWLKFLRDSFNNKVAAEIISMAEPWAIQQKMYYSN